MCKCAAAQGSSVLEGRSVRVCGCAAAQGSGVLEGRSVRVCGSEQWGERECLCLTSVSSKHISKKRTPPSSCDVQILRCFSISDKLANYSSNHH